MALIELINIAKEYKTGGTITKAVEDINLAVEEGDFLSIVGASGSGKTTLLNIIGCMDKPTRGKYFLDGDDVGKKSENDLSKIRGNKIAFVFQGFALLDNDSVYENVELPLLNRNIAKFKRQEIIIDALKDVGISEFATKKVKYLSGGQKQRCGIARAVACGAKVILADEPTGALDSHTSEEIMNLLSGLNRTGTTLIVVTHDMNVANCANRMIELKDGRIIKDETNK